LTSKVSPAKPKKVSAKDKNFKTVRDGKSRVEQAEVSAEEEIFGVKKEEGIDSD